MPTPTTPTTPAAAEEETNLDRWAPIEKRARRSDRIIPTRIWIKERWAPKPRWVIVWDINDIRIRGLNNDDRLVGLDGRYDLLLGSRHEMTALLRLNPQPLDGTHDVLLLSEECVS
jgi:hypothetical protein